MASGGGVRRQRQAAGEARYGRGGACPAPAPCETSGRAAAAPAAGAAPTCAKERAGGHGAPLPQLLIVIVPVHLPLDKPLGQIEARHGRGSHYSTERPPLQVHRGRQRHGGGCARRREASCPGAPARPAGRGWLHRNIEAREIESGQKRQSETGGGLDLGTERSDTHFAPPGAAFTRHACTAPEAGVHRG